jgi:hypothetical protein
MQDTLSLRAKRSNLDKQHLYMAAEIASLRSQ